MNRKVAKCCAVYGWWRYYRTEDGWTYSVRDGKYYFAHGNALTGADNGTRFIAGDELQKLKDEVLFVEN